MKPLFAIALAASLSACAASPKYLDASDVKVTTEKGHGSGVHIGGGYIITAQHVIANRETYTIKSNSGQEYVGEILWENAEYDIALIRIDEPEMETAKVDCTEKQAGFNIVSKGNPFEMEFVQTTGSLASAPITISRWKSAQVADLTIGPGMSGGPVYGPDGRLVGINVGARSYQAGLGSSLTGFAVIVPASAICHLMAL